MTDEEIDKLKTDYYRAMEGLLKADHIIEAFVSVASPASRPYAEVLLRVIREAQGQAIDSNNQEQTNGL